MEEQEEYIAHYGILGMKWGVRRFQNKDGSLTAKGKKRYNDDSANDSEGSTEKKSRFQLTENQKKWVKRGAIAAGVILAAYGGYKLSQSDLVKNFVRDLATKADNAEYARKVEKYKKIEIDESLGLVKKRRKYTPEEDLKEINKSMQYWRNGARNNCTFCTTAYELRRRGYDVSANYTEQGRTMSHVKNFFKNAVVETDDDVIWKLDGMTFPFGTPLSERRAIKRSVYCDKVAERISKYGNGARGNLFGFYPQGGGHSIFWEVQNGKTIFRDGQTGRTYASAKDALQYFTPGKTEFFRMDNLEINKDTIKEAVSNFGQPRVNRNVMEYDVEAARTYREMVINYMRNANCSMQEARNVVRKHYGVKV